MTTAIQFAVDHYGALTSLLFAASEILAALPLRSNALHELFANIARGKPL